MRFIPSFGKRGRRLTVVLSIAIVAIGIFAISNALAVHNDDFQLDGNTAATCPAGNLVCSSSQKDWDDLFAVSNPTATTEAVTPTSVISSSGPFTNATFTRDFQSGANPGACSLTNASTKFCTGDDTTFATGSKDTLDITGWECNHDNNVNSKIDIMNAYSAAYTRASDGDKIMYFGLEKNKDNGTNDVGFWFLQGDASCSAPSGHKPWDGTHTVNDVLVVSEFSNGGGVSNITAYKWVGGSNPLEQIATATGSAGDCKSAFTTDKLCATTNSGANPFNANIPTKWLTSDATLGVGHTVVPPDFFEGGINLTEAFKDSNGGTAPSCFNTFIADTRSSTTTSSTLFDYARGQLGQCNTALSTNAGVSTPPKTGEVAAPTSIGTGSVQSGTDTANLNVTGTGTWSGTLTWYLCGPITSPALCDNHGVSVTSRTVTQASSGTDFISGQATLTSAGRYCWHAHFEPSAASKLAGVKAGDDDGTNECFTVDPVTPTLTTSASCSSTPCVLGTDTLSDTATLSGTASQPGTDGAGGDTGLYKSINPVTPGAAAGGSIGWLVYKPGNCSTAGTAIPTGSPATVSGNKTYPVVAGVVTPVTYKPALADGVGIYTFVATYTRPSVSPNTNAVATPATCANTVPADGEQVTVTGSASSSSAQRWLPNDRVVLNSTGGTTLSGTLTVTLYKGTPGGASLADCTNGTATAVPGQAYTFNPSGDASGTVYQTTNTTLYVGTKPDGTAGNAPDDYFWLVHYVDTNLTDPADRCEKSTVSITD